MKMILALSILVSGLAAGQEAKEDKPAIGLDVDVSNFYIDAGKTHWASGMWEIGCLEGADVAEVHFRLTPLKRGEVRERVGQMPRKDLADLMILLKKEGLFSAKDSKPCGCDAPNFKVTAMEGPTLHQFKLVHNHDDHDAAQRRIVDAIIDEVERRATNKPPSK